MLRSITTRAAQAAVLVALVGGAGAYTTFDRTVTVSVDGTRTEVRTFAKTVDGVLASAGLTVGEHDSLAPGRGATVPADGDIVLDRGRPVDLTVDGSSRTVWVTARSVGEMLGDLDLRTAGAVVSADRSKRIPITGLALSLRLPQSVALTVDGTTRDLTTTTTTVSAMLAEAGVTVAAADLLTPDPASVPVAGMAVQVVRVTTSRANRDMGLAFGSSRVADSGALTGTETVVEPGSDGLRRIVVEVTYHDGTTMSERPVSDEVVRQPVTRVVSYGTKAKPVPKPAPAPAPQPAAQRRSTGDVDSLNWPALAQCESGGNPQSASPYGYYGLYQFSMGTWQSVGGSGRPSDAASSEQTYRAKLLYQREGTSPWPECGRRLFS